MAELHEIMATLFKNPDGYTVSVKPNYYHNGSSYNLSFKGRDTATLAAVRNMSTNSNQIRTAISKILEHKQIQDLYNLRKELTVCRFSKGYRTKRAGDKSGKGKTVPVVGVLWSMDDITFHLHLDWGIEQHDCEFQPDLLTPSQRNNGAVGEYRYMKPDEDEDDDIYSFMGG